jgi:hypothetical protein
MLLVHGYRFAAEDQKISIGAPVSIWISDVEVFKDSNTE